MQEKLNSDNGLELNEKKDYGSFGCYITDAKENSVSKKLLPKKGNDKKSEGVSDDFSAFYELALLRDTSIGAIKDECCLFQIKTLMGKLGKLVVYQGVKEQDAEKACANCSALGVSEITTSATFLPIFVKVRKKSQTESVKINTIVDFPFGESLLKSKISEMKDALKKGADKVTAVISNGLLLAGREKEFKKQCKKIGKVKNASLAVSAMELKEEHFKYVLKIAEKTGVKDILFLFGNVSKERLFDSMKFINKFKGKKPIGVLASVENAEGVKALIKNKADFILTPFADDIGIDLVNKFNIKSVKLC